MGPAGLPADRRPASVRLIVTARPSLAADSWPTAGTMRGPYPDPAAVTALEPVWSTLIEVAEGLGDSVAPGLLRDVTDLGLEVLAGHAVLTFTSILDGHAPATVIASIGRPIGSWRSWSRWTGSPPPIPVTWSAPGSTPPVTGSPMIRSPIGYRTDAKLLITSWVAPGHPLNDYAGRHWSGLLDGYYGARWRLWIEEMRAILQTGRRDPDRFEIRLREWEQDWLDRDDPYPARPTGATVVAAREAWRTLRPDRETEVISRA